MTKADTTADTAQFAARVIIAALIVALALAIWTMAEVFLVGFGGIIVAIALRNAALPVTRRTGLNIHLSIAVVVVLLAAVTFGFLFAFGAQAARQFVALTYQLPAAWEQARGWLTGDAVGRWVLAQVDMAAPGQAITLVNALPWAQQLLAIAAALGLLLVIGVYLAVDGETYIRGALRLLPPPRRPRGRAILNATGSALRQWLIAMTLDMAFLGLITGIGLWLVGVPFSLVLGVLSGISVFVPYIGPILAILPGLLFASSVDPTLMLYAGLVYLVTQQLEAHISQPLLQRWTVAIPPAVTLLALVGFGLLFGFWGVLFATPLAVTLLTVVRMAYVEDFLEKRGHSPELPLAAPSDKSLASPA